MPFLWETIATKGQIYGNRDINSKVNVTNQYWFSYPGYNEIFTGYGDSIINSNDYPPNPNTTIQEFVNKQPGYEGKVATFASWAAFNRIMNEDRCGFPVNAGYEAVVNQPNAAEQALSDVQFMFPKVFGRSERPDGITFMLAKEYLKKNHPKFLQISFIETDAYAHRDSYEYYLESAYANDSMIRNIWNLVQSDPFYKDQTTILITSDHGRGEGDEWKNHARRIVEADQIWMAVIGPGIKPLGETKDIQIYQNQFAQTMAALLGLQFTSPKPIGPVVKTVLEK
jgi:predicted AlkP superfamily pyrophosphatase or phosphodiesterase